MAAILFSPRRSPATVTQRGRGGRLQQVPLISYTRLLWPVWPATSRIHEWDKQVKGASGNCLLIASVSYQPNQRRWIEDDALYP